MDLVLPPTQNDIPSSASGECVVVNKDVNLKNKPTIGAKGVEDCDSLHH